MTDPALAITGVLDDELRRWLMAVPRYPVLAVVTADGAPSQSVMWFDLDPERSDTILMNTMKRRAKYSWMEREPRVSLCFANGYGWVALQGQVELDREEDRALEGIKSLARRYGYDPEPFNGQSRVTIRLRVDRVIRHDD